MAQTLHTGEKTVGVASTGGTRPLATNAQSRLVAIGDRESDFHLRSPAADPSGHCAQNHRFAGIVVGIEFGCACCRRRVTSLALSVARWVHNSAMATFSEAPLSCRTAGFPRSGWKSWPVDGEPSHPRRGSSAGTHTPQTRTVCSPLRVISCVG